MKITIDKIITGLFVVIGIVGFVWTSTPTTAVKEARGLEFHVTETPDGVWFDWANASTNQTHSIYRRLSGTAEAWERVALDLTGANGGTLFDGFTLDQTWDYELREDAPE